MLLAGGEGDGVRVLRTWCPGCGQTPLPEGEPVEDVKNDSSPILCRIAGYVGDAFGGVVDSAFTCVFSFRLR